MVLLNVKVGTKNRISKESVSSIKRSSKYSGKYYGTEATINGKVYFLKERKDGRITIPKSAGIVPANSSVKIRVNEKLPFGASYKSRVRYPVARLAGLKEVRFYNMDIDDVKIGELKLSMIKMAKNISKNRDVAYYKLYFVVVKDSGDIQPMIIPAVTMNPHTLRSYENVLINYVNEFVNNSFDTAFAVQARPYVVNVIFVKVELVQTSQMQAKAMKNI